jgi:hypothetical protein
LFQHALVSRNFIRFCRFAFAVKFEDAVLDVSTSIPRNTYKIHHRARPASYQQLQWCHTDMMLLLRQAEHMLIFRRQRLEIDGQFGQE